MFTHIQPAAISSTRQFEYACESQGLQRGELAKLTGPAIFLDRISGNGRKYIPESVHAQIAELQPRIAKKALFGELDHPPVNDLQRLAYVQMQNVSHRIDALWYDEKTKAYMITITVLDTPSGRILKSIIDSGSPIYVSLRSLLDPARNVQRNGYIDAWMLVLVTCDVVSRPGFADAVLEPVDVAANEAALAVCESLNLFSNFTSKRNFDMSKKTKYVPLIALEALAGVAVEPTDNFKKTVTAFIADVIDKLPGKFTTSDFMTTYPDSMFDGNVIGLYTDTAELMIRDAETKNVAMIKLTSKVDDEFYIDKEATVDYYDTESMPQSNDQNKVDNSAASAGTEMYAIVSTEDYDPSAGFIQQAETIATMLRNEYADGFTMDQYNSEIGSKLSEEYNVQGRIDCEDDECKLCLTSDDGNDGACIALTKAGDQFIPGQVAEFYNPAVEAEIIDDIEIAQGMPIKVTEGEEVLDEGICQECGTLGDYREMIAEEDEQAADWLAENECDDATPVAKVNDKWYIGAENCKIEPDAAATESLEGVQQQTEGNQNNPLKIDENYMNNGEVTHEELEQAEIIDPVDDENKGGEDANKQRTDEMFEIVEGDMAEIVEDEPAPEDTSDKKPKVADDDTEKDNDDANFNELATEAQRIFGMPNSKFAGNYAIENMPGAYKHIWAGLTDAAKQTIALQAEKAMVATEAQNLQFWAKTNFIAIERACLVNKGSVQVALESLQVEDPRSAFLKGLTKGIKLA